MIPVIRQWLDALNHGERDLNSQGYVVLHGAAGSFIVPINLDRYLPGRRRILLWENYQLQLA